MAPKRFLSAKVNPGCPQSWECKQSSKSQRNDEYSIEDNKLPTFGELSIYRECKMFSWYFQVKKDSKLKSLRMASILLMVKVHNISENPGQLQGNSTQILEYYTSEVLTSLVDIYAHDQMEGKTQVLNSFQGENTKMLL